MSQKSTRKHQKQQKRVTVLNETAKRNCFITNKPILLLLILYSLSVCCRYLLSIFTVNIPTVYIDEGLYINIARSLFHDGMVMYRDQPISYVYLVYPIALMPLFFLPPSVSLFRAVQFYNAALISSSVFPAYLLGRKVGLNRNRSLLLAFLTLLVPEFALSSFLTAESLYYPLMIWSFVIIAVICSKQPQEKQGHLYIMLGLLTGLMYFIKPICVIFGTCFLIINLARGILQRQKSTSCYSAVSLAIIAVVVVLGYLFYNAKFGKATVLNLYEKQISGTTVNSIPIMLQAVPYHVMALVFGCGGSFVLLPFIYQKSYSESNRKLMLASMVGILASIIGIAIMVVPYNYTGNGLTSPVHLRYLMFYFPLIYCFFLSDDFPQRKMSRSVVLILAVFTVLSIFPSAFHFFNYQAGTFDAPSLNAFYSDRIDPGYGIVLIILSTILMLYLVFISIIEKWYKHMTALAIVSTILCMSINGFATYAARKSPDISFEKNATQVANAIYPEDNVLIVTTNRYDDSRAFSIDSHLHKPVQMVVMNDVLLNAVYEEGVYRSWTPFVQAPNTANNPTIEADTLVFDITTADYVEFTEYVQTTEIGDYVIAKITPEKPFLKTAIASMDGFTLHSEDTGSLLVYDKEILERGYITLTIVMRSYTSDGCTVTFSCEGESKEIAVNSSYQTYEITLPITQNDFFHFSIQPSADIIISEYWTK